MWQLRKLIIFILFATTSASVGFCKHREMQRVTVKQLTEYLSDSHRLKDRKLADEIAYLKLTERLSTTELTELEKGLPGQDSRQALTEVADESAFLDPPSAEILSLPIPNAAAQREILYRTSAYLKSVNSLWPDLSATRLTSMYSGSSTVSAQIPLYSDLPEVASELFRPLRIEETSSATMVFRGGRAIEEHVKVDTNGELDRFRDHLMGGFYFEPSGLIDLINQHRLTWYHWEQGAAGPIAVFQYTYRSYFNHQPTGLSSQITYDEDEEKISVNPVDGSILRLTLFSSLKSNGMRGQSVLIKEFESVQIGGKIYVCPTKSVAIDARSVMLLQPMDLQAYIRRTGRAELPVREYLSDIRFTDYHLFRGDTRILPEIAPAADATPGKTVDRQLPAPEVSPQPH